MPDDIYAWRPGNIEGTPPAAPQTGGDIYSWRPANVEQVSPQEYEERSRKAGAAVGRTGEEQRQILGARGFSPEAVKQLGSQYDLSLAREQERQAGYGAADVGGEFLRSGLGFADLFGAKGTDKYNQARQRFAAGNPEPGDAQTIARYEQLRQNEAQGTILGSKTAADIAKGVLGIPKIAQEAIAGGAALRALGVGAAAAEGATLGQRAYGAAVAAPTQLLAMPSMWREQARQKNLDNGRDTNDVRGFGPAVVNGLANVIVLNRLQSGIAAGGLGGMAKKGGAFVIEQNLAESGLNLSDAIVKSLNEDFGNKFKMSTGYGVFEHLASGEFGEAMKQATGQFLLGATFAGLHKAGAFGDAMEAGKEDLADLKKKGLTPDEAGRAIVEQYKTFQNALADNPNLTRSEAETYLAKAGIQPGKFLVSVMHNLPRSRATAEFQALKNEFDEADLAKIRQRIAGPLPEAAKVGVAPAAVARADAYLRSLGEPPPPPKPGMVRLYRGNFEGQTPHEHAFFSDDRGLAGVAIPFARSEGRNLVYVDVPADVAKAGLHTGAVTEGEYSLPKEYREKVKVWGQKPGETTIQLESGRRLGSEAAKAPGVAPEPSPARLGETPPGLEIARPGASGASEKPTERYFRTPDSKGAEDNVDAAVKELIGDTFAGKWFSRTFEGNAGYKGHVQLEFHGGRLGGPKDVVEKGEKDVRIGGEAPMYLHPALSAIRYRGPESGESFAKLKDIVDAANQERATKGIEPIELITGKAAKEAPNAARIGIPEGPGRTELLAGETPERAGPLPPAAEGPPDRAVAQAVAEGEAGGGVQEREGAAPLGPQAEEAQLREGATATHESLTPESQRIVMRDPFLRELFEAAGVKIAEPRQKMGERKGPTAADDAATKMLMDKINENAANPPSNPTEIGVGAARKGLPDLRDTEWFRGLQAAAKRFVQRVQDFTGRLAGATAPRTSRHSEEAGNDIARLGSAKQYANAAAPTLLERIMVDPAHNDAASRDAIGAVMIEDSLRYAREQHLAAGRDEKAANVGTVIGSGRTAEELAANPLKSEADYQRLRAEPWVQDAIKRYEQEYVPLKEKYYRESQGLEPTDPLGSETQIPGRPIYRHSLAEGELRHNAGGDTGGAAGQARGNMTAQRARKLGQSMEAKGTGHYEIDLGKIIEADLRSLVPNAAKAKLYRTLVEKGLGKWARPGEGPDIYQRIPDVRPPRGTQEAQKGEIDLYVHPDVYDEVRQVLAVDQPANALPFTGALATATLASTVEATYHLRNLLSLITRPGMNPLTFMKNVRKIVQGDAEVKQRIMELTEIGAAKEHGSESPNNIPTGWIGGRLNPLNYVGKDGYLSRMMTVADRAMRLTADHAFDKLVEAGKFKDTEAARRDFINQLGNYNKLTQPKWVAWLRDTGLGPFATAGTNFFMQGLRALTLSHGGKATSGAADAALRAEMLLRMAVLPAVAAGINMAIWGRPDGDDKTPLFGLKLGEKDGKTSYLDLGGFVPLSRGMRETGLMALSEGMREGAKKAGAKSGDTIDRAFGDISSALLHPAEGPIISMAHTAITGRNTLGMQVAPQANVKKGESQAEMNVYAALFQANPILESWFRPVVSEQAGIKEKKKEPTTEERLFKMLGPFGVKGRSQAPGAPHRTMTIPLGAAKPGR